MTEPGGAIGEPTNRRSRNLVEARGLAFAGLLAAPAGMVDVIGYLHLHGLFVSYMSGNSTQLAAALGQGNFGVAGTIAKLVMLFVLGAAAGQVLAGVTGEWSTSSVLAGVTVLLTIAALLAAAAEPMVFAMGALNASMHRAGTIPVSLTFVTGVLVRFGQRLGDFLTRRSSEWQWLAQAVPWLSARIGMLFGPIMSVWFVALAFAGLWQVTQMPAVFAALDPSHGYRLLFGHGWTSFLTLGSVFLALTGAEALYADMGHFGRAPIRLDWFSLVLPALVLNYFGQGALVLAHHRQPVLPAVPGVGAVPDGHSCYPRHQRRFNGLPYRCGSSQIKIVRQ